MRLRRKRVVILPAGQGIARANAILCALQGAHPVAAGIEGQARASLAAHRPYDCLFKCACFVHKGTVKVCCGADWDLSFDLGVKSMCHAIRACLSKRAGAARAVTI